MLGRARCAVAPPAPGGVLRLKGGAPGRLIPVRCSVLSSPLGSSSLSGERLRRWRAQARSDAGGPAGACHCSSGAGPQGPAADGGAARRAERCRELSSALGPKRQQGRSGMALPRRGELARHAEATTSCALPLCAASLAMASLAAGRAEVAHRPPASSHAKPALSGRSTHSRWWLRRDATAAPR